jgi:tRNA(Ile2) C34 agmatinyltransferase TiaS
MKTLDKIIDQLDWVFSRVENSALINREDWQVLKTALLTQQTNNLINQCSIADHTRSGRTRQFRCEKCGRLFRNGD